MSSPQSMTYEQFELAIREFLDQGKKLPYGRAPGIGFSGAEELLAWRSEWESFNRYNPPYGYDTPDPAASPKPTWEELWTLYRSAQIRGRAVAVDNSMTGLVEVREELVGRTVSLGGEAHRTGSGINYMAALIHEVENATVAGTELPLITVRRGDHTVKRIRTQREIRALLAEAAHQKNVVETAHNLVKAGYHALAKVRDDVTQPIDVREQKEEEARLYAESYKEKMVATIALVNLDAMPPDDEPDTLREVLLERLEAQATARVRGILAAVAQQGMDLPPSCVEQERALQAVAQIKQAAMIDLYRTDTAAPMKAAFDLAIKKLQNIRVDNAPVWVGTVNNEPLLLDADYSQTLYLEVVPSKLPGTFLNIGTIRVKNPVPTPPRQAADLGKVALVDLRETVEGGTRQYWGVKKVVPKDENTAHDLTLAYIGSPDPQPDVALLEFVARNNCGPSVYRLKIVKNRPAPGA